MEKVILGMSGGVDSALSAHLLQEAGYEVVALHFSVKKHEQTEKDVEDCSKMCQKLGILFLSYSLVEEFQEKIISYYLEEIERGRTPSPCPLCDDIIKFQLLFDVAEKEGANYVATGHYAKVSYVEKFQDYLLEETHHIYKDQCYMLYRLSPTKLKRILFPLASLEKNEVRRLSEERNILVSKKKDSQGICFAPEGYRNFLQKHLKQGTQKGKILDEEGKILGEHEGYAFYTLGQRRGLGIQTKEISFITEINPGRNEIRLGKYEKLLCKEVDLDSVVLHIPWEKLKELSLRGRARFSSQGFFGKLEKRGENYVFVFETANTHNAPGQHLVFFYENYVVGGGIIRERKK